MTAPDRDDDAVDLPRREPLPDGRALVVRLTEESDVDGVLAVYQSLSLEDRYRRFFSGFRPTRAFVASWLGCADRGGCSLVAEVVDERVSPPVREIVGEAGYTPLPDGGAELALTVSRSWRGWLGPYLLDVLVAVAHQRGVTVLEAEVLTENRAMQAVMARRGEAILDRPDWTVVRVAIATEGRVPPFPPDEHRPHVLVEGVGGRWREDAALREAGLAVAGCAGPGRLGGHCPALHGHPCPLADSAVVIVCALPADDPRTAALLEAHSQLHPRARVLTDDGREGADDLKSCRASAEVVRRIEDLVVAPRP